jgi:hypothetical protein
MNAKNLIAASLLLFVAASLVVLTVKAFRQEPQAEVAPQASAAASAQASSPESLDNVVIAYYFHGNTRCPTCRTIESFAEEAVKSGFAEEIRDGRVEWRVLNYEEPANKPFVDQYEILAPIVVLSKYDSGQETRWARLDEVWNLTDDKEAFVAYVQKEAKTLLE